MPDAAFEALAGDHAERLEALRRDWPAASFRRDDEGALVLAARIFAARPEPGRRHLLLRGTNFQIRVWEALIKLPPATLISYGDLAARVDRPQAARAVGSAVAANAIAYLIPCHRVIREDGSSSNYRWDTERKLALRAWELGRTG